MMLQGRECTWQWQRWQSPIWRRSPAPSWLEVCIKTCLSSRLVILLSVHTKQKTSSCTELVQSWSLSHSKHSSSPTNIASFLGNWVFPTVGTKNSQPLPAKVISQVPWEQLDRKLKNIPCQIPEKLHEIKHFMYIFTLTQTSVRASLTWQALSYNAQFQKKPGLLSCSSKTPHLSPLQHWEQLLSLEQSLQ